MNVSPALRRLVEEELEDLLPIDDDLSVGSIPQDLFEEDTKPWLSQPVSTTETPNTDKGKLSFSLGLAYPTATVPAVTVQKDAASPLYQSLLSNYQQALEDMGEPKKQLTPPQPTLHHAIVQSLQSTTPISPKPVVTPAKSAPPRPVSERTSLVPLAPKTTGNLLHRLLAAGQATLAAVQHLLEVDPSVVDRQATVYRTRHAYRPSAGKVAEQRRRLPYKYPLHIALDNTNTSQDVLNYLIAHAERHYCLQLTDGAMKETALLLAIKKRPREVKLLDSLMLACPLSTSSRDRLGNTIVHVAVQHGAGEDALRHLCILQPEALSMRNMNGQRPLEVAQQRTTSSDAVVDFLAAREMQRVC